MIKKILRKKIIIIPILLLLILGGYFGYNALTNKNKETRYVTAAVEKGTLVVSISGSGQISVSSQADIKPKTAGDVVYVGMEKGQEVKAGTILVRLNDNEAQKSVRDVEINLESAKIALEQTYSSKNEGKNAVGKTYEDGFNEVDNTFGDLPVFMDGLKDMLFSDSLEGNAMWNLDVYKSYGMVYDTDRPSQYGNDIYYTSYHEAKKSYEKNFNDYKTISRFSERDKIEFLINETYETTKIIGEALKNTYNLIHLYKKGVADRGQEENPIVETYILSLNNYINKANNHISNLLSAQNAINALKTDTESDLLDIQSKELIVKQKENTLSDAKEKLSDYYIRAPFDGIIAETEVKKGDSVSASTILASIITQQKIAEISLNEVDVSKVKIGQKVNLTFDALPDLSISGKVVDVDAVGTVNQGVVSYGVKIAFDTQDERIKSGMSVAADIITDVKQDVLVLPSSAIKSQGNSYYVELVEASEETKQQLLANVSGGIILPKAPKLQAVETGLSNDTSTEIVSGLKEGDIIITSTITPSSTQSNQNRANQNFQIPGIGGRR